MTDTEPRSWRQRLLALNLILPILEIEAIGEAFRMAGALSQALLSRPGRREQ